MAKLSRRAVLSSLAVAPASAALPMAPRSPPPTPDPIVAEIAAWLAARDRAEALLTDWQCLEGQLSLKCKPMSLTEASRRGFAEVRQMRALDRRYKRLAKKLDRAAGRITAMRASSAAGGLAKLEMALRILEPMDCEEFSWALIQGGFEDLRALL